MNGDQNHFMSMVRTESRSQKYDNLLSFMQTIVFLATGLSFLTPSNVTGAGFNERERFVLVNYGSDYVYSLCVNGEPLDYGRGFALFDWEGFPIASGSNSAIFTASELMDNAEPVSCMITTGTTNHPISSQVEGAFSSNSFTNKVTFNTSGQLPQQASIDLLPAGQARITNELKLVALRLTKDFGDRNFEALSLLTGLPAKDITAGYPNWFRDAHAVTTTTRVGKIEDLTVLTGKYFVAIGPSLDWFRQNKDGDLVTIENVGLKAKISKSCWIFCRRNNHWCLVLSGSNIVELIL